MNVWMRGVLVYALVMFVVMMVMPFVVRRHPSAQELDDWDRNAITALMMMASVAWPLFWLLPRVLNAIADLLERAAERRKSAA